MPGNRIKVVNNIGDLVSVFYSCNTDVKKKVFQELTKKWCTVEEIKEKYGEEGEQALKYLENIKFVETQWVTTENGVVRAYHTYYDLFQITLNIPIMEAAEVLRVIVMSEEEFEEWENKIMELVKGGSSFIGYLVENLGISQIMLRALIKRSEKLEIKGMRVEVM